MATSQWVLNRQGYDIKEYPGMLCNVKSVFSLKQVPCNVIQSICELMSTSTNNNFSRSHLVLRFNQLRFSMLNSLLVVSVRL